MTSSPIPLLSLSNIKKTFSPLTDQDDCEWVLNGISLELEKGESLALLGPSGSGKSTLLNIIGGLDTATSGKYLLDGKDISTFTEGQSAEIRRLKIGFIFQFHYLLPQCTVLENILVPTLALKRSEVKPNAGLRAKELLDRVGLSHRVNHRPGELSGGEKQRVAVVRALINKPLIVLADEPTGSLDRENAENLIELLAELNKHDQTTLIMVTHDVSLANKLESIKTIKSGQLVSCEKLSSGAN
jgi:ABC-type lipoprotein export system ATPase subunit